MLPTVQERDNVTKEIRTAARHGAVYGLGSILAKGIGFLMLPFYTRYLNPVDYGTLEILDLSMSLFGMFLTMGMTAAFLRSYAGAESVQEQKKTVSTAFLFVATSGLVTFLLLVGAVRSVSTLILGPNVPATYLLISFTSFIISYIANIPRTYLRAREASGTFVLVETLALILTLGLNIYFIAVLKIGLLGILLSSLVVISIQLVLLTAWTLRDVGLRFSRPLLTRMARFGLPLMLSNLSLFMLNFSDRFFLQHLRSLEVVGIYAVGYKFAYMLNYLVVQPFYIMWQSRMYAIHADRQHASIFGQIFALYALVLTYAGLALSLFSPEVVHLMVGPQFSSSQSVVPIVALAYIFNGLGFYVQVGMLVMNRTRLIGLIGTGVACLNAGLNYVLILKYGMLGAAWATLLSFVAWAACSYLLSQRLLPLPLEWSRVGLMIGIAIVIYLACTRWGSDLLVGALLIKTVVLAGFPILLWKLGIVSQAEIGSLRSTWGEMLARTSRVFALVSGKAVSP